MSGRMRGPVADVDIPDEQWVSCGSPDLLEEITRLRAREAEARRIIRYLMTSPSWSKEYQRRIEKWMEK